MAIIVNGAVLDWYEESIIMNDTTISSKLAPGDVYYNGTKVFGLSGTYSTVVNSGGLAPDSSNFENNIVPVLNGLVGLYLKMDGVKQKEVNYQCIEKMSLVLWN